MTIVIEPGKLEKKILKTVSRGYTYGYYSCSAKEDKATVLLLHGWPDDSSLYFGLANQALIPNGYGVIVPDCLGYSLTDKPKDPKEYDFAKMAKEFVEIIQNEGVEKVIVLGHDWGSALAQQFYFFQPDHCKGLAMCNVAYSPPTKEKVDMKEVNDRLEKVFGYRCFEYMFWFASDESDQICQDHLESLFHLLHSNVDPNGSQTPQPGIFQNRDMLKGFLISDHKPESHPSITPEFKQHWIDRLTKGGMHGPFNYYRQLVHLNDGVHGNKAGPIVEVPTLYIGYKGDLICRTELIQQSVQQGLLPDLTNITLLGGHWGLLHDGEPFNQAVLQWLDKLK